METLFIIIFLALLLGIYDLLRKANTTNAHQTEEIKKLHDSLKEYMKFVKYDKES